MIIARVVLLELFEFFELLLKVTHLGLVALGLGGLDLRLVLSDVLVDRLQGSILKLRTKAIHGDKVHQPVARTSFINIVRMSSHQCDLKGLSGKASQLCGFKRSLHAC